MSLQASLSLAADVPGAVTRSGFPETETHSVLLGRDLFFDPILSGNRNISCATCHHPALAAGDGMSLSLGEGGIGLGTARRIDPANAPRARIARNAPALYNLGAAEFRALFHDGRVAADPAAPFGIRMPPGFALERPVPSPLAAQAILPMTANDEMAGQGAENEVSAAIAAGRIRGQTGAWQLLADRVNAIPAYRTRFDWIIGRGTPLHVTDIGAALAAYIAFDFRSTDAPFDAALRGDGTALGAEAQAGMALFYGKAGCGTCHSGPYLTDHAFHAIGVPPLGPGKGHGEGYADHGRAGVTGDPADAYRFRTPSLRNVTLTAPYGHNGAFARLEDMVRHHLDPLTSLAEYSADRALLHDVALEVADDAALMDFDEMLRLAMAVEIEPISLEDAEIAAILAFLAALEDPGARSGRLGLPGAVPSGLPVETP
ncbi:cytochrome-c peroxidase [Roseovarius aquimarinus]|uniref:Cytochrome-c peroxidase n=1 Tax=Roseovarius aquimarinus TaxID=1229156 RepID=A0ABW7I3Z2_9RHOB